MVEQLRLGTWTHVANWFYRGEKVHLCQSSGLTSCRPMNTIGARHINHLVRSGNDTQKLTRWFILSSGTILLITGIAKVLSAFGEARILGTNDPILGVSFRSLMSLAGVIELVISGICFLTNKYALSLDAIAWIATVFLSYHFGLSYVHWHRPCPCLGNLTDLVHIPPSLANLILTWVAIYLFLGSVVCRIRTSKVS